MQQKRFATDGTNLVIWGSIVEDLNTVWHTYSFFNFAGLTNFYLVTYGYADQNVEFGQISLSDKGGNNLLLASCYYASNVF